MRMHRSHGPLSRLNDLTAWVLASIVFASALPLASNRSGWWLIWTAALTLVATVHLHWAGRAGPGHRPRFLRFAPAFVVAALVPAAAVIQTLPLAGWLPGELTRMHPGLESLAGPAISVQPDVALAGVLRFAGYLVLLALVLEVATRRDRVERIATVLFGGVVLQAVWALVALRLLGDFSPWGPKVAYQGAATGTFINRNSLATLLAFGLVLGIGLLVHRGQRDRPRTPRSPGTAERLGPGGIAILLGLAPVALALVSTQSRLGLASAVAGVLVALALARLQAGLRPRRVAAEALAATLGLALLVFLYTGGEGVLARFVFAQDDGVGRLALYRQTLEMIALRPLTGFGFDAFGAAFEAFRAPPLLAPGNYDLAHNSYLGLWAELGLVFGSLPMLLLACAGFVLWRRRTAPDGFSGMAIAGLGVLTVAAVHSAGDFSLEVPAVTYLFIAILGLGLGTRSARRRVPKPEPRRAATPLHRAEGAKAADAPAPAAP